MPVVVATKLAPPRPGRFVLARPRLARLLDDARECRLVVVAAPPGWGKTTLLTSWCAAASRATAWLALDADDNDPSRFWAHLVEAVRRVEPMIGAQARAALKVPGARPRLVALPLLVNDLGSLDHGLTIVVDDYHVIAEPSIHDGVSYLIEHLPPGCQLVLVTRSDPPLALPRLRVRGELAEIRATDLGLSSAETVELLRDGFGVRLDDADAALLHGKTEGWAAAVHLAALALRGHVEPSRFVAAFGATNRHVVDYLATEVVGWLDPELASFLLETSILHRLCAPLCDAVRARTGSGSVLEALVRANVLVEPVGDDEGWFRCHGLFADLLRLELETREPQRLSVLHARAASWFEAAGAYREAIHHALRADDPDRAAELVGRHWNAPFNEGQHATVTAWLDALPAALVAGSPRLAAARAWIALDAGDLGAADRWIELAEGAGGTDEGTLIVRAVQRFKAGDLGATNAALDGIGTASASDFVTTVTRILRGAVAYWRGDPRGAVPLLEEAVARADAVGNALGSTYAGGYLALALADLGRLEAACVAANRALAASDADGRKEHFVTMMPLLGQARVQTPPGDAEQHLLRAVELGERGGSRIEQAGALVALAEHQRRRGALGQARAAEARARQLLALCTDPGPVQAPRPARSVRSPRDDGVSDRELEVLRLLATQLSQREIGCQLFVSLNTVKTHARNVFRKLGVASREEAVARARERGLI